MFTYYPLEKSFEKQTEKHVNTLVSLSFSNKIDKLKKKENQGIFSKNQLDGLIIDKLKEFMQLQNNMKLDDLEHTTKRVKCFNFRRSSLPIAF